MPRASEKYFILAMEDDKLVRPSKSNAKADRFFIRVSDGKYANAPSWTEDIDAYADAIPDQDWDSPEVEANATAIKTAIKERKVAMKRRKL